MYIYIKLFKKYNSYMNKTIKLRDIAEVHCESSILPKLNNTIVYNINNNKKQNYIISIIDIIRILKDSYSKYNFISLGEKDIIISYYPNGNNQNKLWLYTKIVFVCCILLFGSALAIISFHEDAGMYNTQITICRLISGNEKELLPYFQVAYSVGVFLGIVIFFNHFSSKMITDDPTPIEVELNSYENLVEDCLIDTMIENKRNKNDS